MSATDRHAARFGRRVRELREQAGLSQRRLAAAVHVDHSVLSRIERGDRAADRKLAQALDAALNAGGELAGTTADERGSRPPRSRVNRTGRHPPPPPPDTPFFIGREAELGHLDAFLSVPDQVPTTVGAHTCVISGMAGVGKTALAVRAAWRHAESFPDGCLFVDLAGFTPGRAALSPSEALEALLGDLGMDAAQLPRSDHGRATAYRTLTAEARLLVVLDNAASTAQISPLLAAGPGCRTLITSRSMLPALDEADQISLPPLDERQALKLFQVLVRRTEPAQAAVRLIRHSGGVPLAVRVLAARCRLDAHLAPEALADELDAADRAIALVDDGERSMEGAVAVSVARLPADECALFLHLGLFPQSVVDEPAVAALAGISVFRARHLVERLASAHLLHRDARGRRGFHDLIAAYAATAAERRIEPAEARAAVARILSHYLSRATAADRVLTPHRHRFAFPRVTDIDAAVGGPPVSGVPDFEAASAWLTAHVDMSVALCDLAYRHGFDVHCWQLAYTMRGIFFAGRYLDRWEQTHDTALAAAARLGDPVATVCTLNNLGLALGQLGRRQEALVRLEESIAIAREAGDGYGEHTARSHRAWLLHQEGRYTEALHEQEAALAFHRKAGSARNAAIILRDAAESRMRLGDTARARADLHAALVKFRMLGLALDEAMTLNSLGELHAAVGDAAGSGLWHGAALEVALRIFGRFETARAHAGIALAARASGRPARARHHAARAVRLYREIGAQEQDRIVSVLAEPTTET